MDVSLKLRLKLERNAGGIWAVTKRRNKSATYQVGFSVCSLLRRTGYETRLGDIVSSIRKSDGANWSFVIEDIIAFCVLTIESTPQKTRCFGFETWTSIFVWTAAVMFLFLSWDNKDAFELLPQQRGEFQ